MKNQKLIGTVNAGYEIIKTIGDYVLGFNPNSINPYVVWGVSADGSFKWGKYSKDKKFAETMLFNKAFCYDFDTCDSFYSNFSESSKALDFLMFDRGYEPQDASDEVYDLMEEYNFYAFMDAEDFFEFEQDALANGIYYESVEFQGEYFIVY